VPSREWLHESVSARLEAAQAQDAACVWARHTSLWGHVLRHLRGAAPIPLVSISSGPTHCGTMIIGSDPKAEDDSSARFLLDAFRKGKRAERRGRKAMGLWPPRALTARPPKKVADAPKPWRGSAEQARICREATKPPRARTSEPRTCRQMGVSKRGLGPRPGTSGVGR